MRRLFRIDLVPLPLATAHRNVPGPATMGRPARYRLLPQCDASDITRLTARSTRLGARIVTRPAALRRGRSVTTFAISVLPVLRTLLQLQHADRQVLGERVPPEYGPDGGQGISGDCERSHAKNPQSCSHRSERRVAGPSWVPKPLETFTILREPRHDGQRSQELQGSPSWRLNLTNPPPSDAQTVTASGANHSECS